MATSTSTKHMVLIEKPIGTRISIAYSTLKEAQHQTIALERAGYTIIGIVETTLPPPNA